MKGRIRWIAVHARQGNNSWKVLRDEFQKGGGLFLDQGSPIVFHEILRSGNMRTTGGGRKEYLCAAEKLELG